jgi:tRNA (guanine-N7-)-methyltransferase
LLEGLSPVFPDRFILGLEIRDPVVESVQERLAKLCKKSASYGNLGVKSLNAMKHLPNFFEKGQLEGMFFLYADPHFVRELVLVWFDLFNPSNQKKKKKKSRIISVDLLDVYAYVLRPGGRIYTVTDVEDLHNWEVEALGSHPCFVRVADEEARKDPAVPVMLVATDEAAKAKREGRGQWWSVYQRI